MGYKRNENGNVVTTKLQPQVLRSIAEEGGGSYYEIRNGSSGIDAFLGRLDELQQGEFASQEYTGFENQYQWLAGLGLTFLLLGMIFPSSRSHKATSNKMTKF